MSDHGYTPCLLVAPNHAWGRACLRAQALEGKPVAGVRVVVPDDLMFELAEPFLGKLDPLSPAAGPWLAERAMAVALANGKPSRFKALLAQDSDVVSSFPNLGITLFALIDRLRREGWEPEALLAAAPKGSEEKFSEIAGLLEAWVRCLAEDGWADWRSMHDLALGAFPDAARILGAKRLKVPGYWLWDRVVARFLRQLAKALKDHGGEVEWMEGPSTDLPSGPLGHLERLAGPKAANLEEHPLAFVLDDGVGKLPGVVTKKWEFFCASSPSAELREGLRRALYEGNTPLDQIVVYSADPMAHESAARGMANSLGLPVSIGVPRPHIGSPSAEGLRALLRWASGGQIYGELGLALNQGWLKAEHPHLLAGSLEKLNLGYGWRRAEAKVLESLRHYWASRSEPREKVELADERFKEVADFCADLVSGFPDPDLPVALGQLASWLGRLGRKWTRAAGEDEASERAALLSALAAVSRVTKGHEPYPFEQACLLLLEVLDSERRGGQASQSGAWHLGPIGAPAEPGRRTVLLLGLESGLFPGALQPDPFLEEHELAVLKLPTQEERVQERLAIALQAFCGLGKPDRLIVGWRGADFAEGRSKSPSSLALQIFRLKHGPDADYKALEEEAGDPCGPLPISPEKILSSDEAAAALPELALTLAEKGWGALSARRKDAATAFDGLAGQALPEVDPRGAPWSPSALETFLECPRRTLFDRFLHLRESDEAGEVPDAWLEADEAGTLLHGFYEWAARQHAWPDAGATRTKMAEIFAEWELRVPSPSEALLRAQQDQLVQEALRFKGFMEKSLPDGWQVDSPEIGFGGKGEAEVRIGKGRLQGLRMRGRVDLVLKKGNARSVWDHKTGSSKSYAGNAAALLSHGKLQMHAYVVAMQAIADKEGKGVNYQAGGYLFPTYRGGYSVLQQDLNAEEALEGLETVLAPALDAAVAGDWRVGPDPFCGFCPYLAACDARFAVKKRKAAAEVEQASAPPPPSDPPLKVKSLGKPKPAPKEKKKS